MLFVSPLFIFLYNFLDGREMDMVGYFIAFVLLFIGVVGNVAIFMWILDWYLLCVALMLGDNSPADLKVDALERQLNELECRT